MDTQTSAFIVSVFLVILAYITGRIQGKKNA